tara:strand:- start:4230 stop:4712 length:483 start_codon:yes stop_codon:yes gene_type:complete
MEIDPRAYDELFTESVDDYDLAENFGFFVEDYILFDDDSHERYVGALRNLPPTIRRLYLAFIAQISVEGNGFQTYFTQIDEDDLKEDTIEGLRILSREAAISWYTRALSYPAFRAEEECLSAADETSSEIHSAFLGALGDDFWDDLGQYLRKHRESALKN